MGFIKLTIATSLDADRDFGCPRGISAGLWRQVMELKGQIKLLKKCNDCLEKRTPESLRAPLHFGRYGSVQHQNHATYSFVDFPFFLPHLAAAAFLALSLRCLGDNRLARLRPPFLPISAGSIRCLGSLGILVIVCQAATQMQNNSNLMLLSC